MQNLYEQLDQRHSTSLSLWRALPLHQWQLSVRLFSYSLNRAPVRGRFALRIGFEQHCHSSTSSPAAVRPIKVKGAPSRTGTANRAARGGGRAEDVATAELVLWRSSNNSGPSMAVSWRDVDGPTVVTALVRVAGQLGLLDTEVANVWTPVRAEVTISLGRWRARESPLSASLAPCWLLS